jgi:Flp pilus assembly protein TadG
MSGTLQLLRSRRCVAALEVALLAPVFILLLAGAVDLSRAALTWSRLQAALAVGANYALVNGGQIRRVGSGDPVALATKIADLVANSTLWTGNPTAAPVNVTVVVNNGPTAAVTNGNAVSSNSAADTESCYCLSGSPNNWSWGSAVSCSSTCTGSAAPPGRFVTISASLNFTPSFAGYGFIASGPMTTAAAVQAQ